MHDNIGYILLGLALCALVLFGGFKLVKHLKAKAAANAGDADGNSGSSGRGEPLFPTREK